MAAQELVAHLGAAPQLEDTQVGAGVHQAAQCLVGDATAPGDVELLQLVVAAGTQLVQERTSELRAWWCGNVGAARVGA